MAITTYINAQEFRRTLVDQADKASNEALYLLNATVSGAQLDYVNRLQIKADVILSIVDALDKIVAQQYPGKE